MSPYVPLSALAARAACENSSFRIPFQIFEVRTALIWGTAAFEPKKNWSDKKITELSQIFEHPIACKQ